MIDGITSIFGFRIANKNLLVIFLLGIVLRLIYLDYTPYDVRVYDVQGHLDYINYISENHKLPKPDQCWECYQNPFYYVLSARLLDILAPVSDKTFFRILQMLSLMFYAGFLLFGIAIIKEVMEKRKYVYLASAMLVFWPSGIIDSARIGNDDAMYFFYAAGLFFLIKWIRTKKAIFIPLLIVATMLSYLSKANGLVLAVVAISVFISDFVAKKKNFRMAYVTSMGFLVALAIIIMLAVRPFSGEMKKMLSGSVVRNVSSLNGGLRVENGLRNYLFFDADDFFHKPFADSWHDIGGRQFFINYLLKTSMFDEYSFGYRANALMAICMGYLLLPIFLLSLLGTVSVAEGNRPEMGALVLNGGFLLISLIFLRTVLPFSCSGDFRYIVPVTVSIVILFVNSLEHFFEKGFFFVERAGFFIGYAFIGLAIAFYLDPFIMNLMR